MFVLTIVYIYFCFSTLYVLFLSVAGLFSKPSLVLKEPPSKLKKVVVLVPAYKEDAVIVSSAKNLLQVDYPSHLLDIVVIADSLQAETLEALKRLPITLIEVFFDTSTKAKALNKAMASLSEDYEIAIISDADNNFAPDFISKINAAFNNGCTVVQGKRVAKNLNTPLAVLDACSEAVNNHLFRKGTNALGLSSAVIGSGMAFRYAELKTVMADIDAVGGFDRILQLKMIERNHFIHYLDSAVVYDEKVDNPESFTNQRRRWNASQYKYLKAYFIKGIKMLLRGNVSYFNLAILNNVFLSRILNLGVIGTLAIVFSLWSGIPQAVALAWWLLLLLYAFALLIPIAMTRFDGKLFEAVGYLPIAFFLMVTSMLKLRGADKKFIHTSHKVSDNNEIH